MITAKVVTLILFIIYVIEAETKCNNAAPSQTEKQYGIVIDAGSTGSRIYAYKWEPREEPIKTVNGDNLSIPPQSEPVLIKENCGEEQEVKTPKWEVKGYKMTPGVSAIDTEQEAKDHIKLLIKHIKTLYEIAAVPDLKKIPIYLKATAGLRLLDHDKRIQILHSLRNAFNDPSINPFAFKDTYSIIASGTEEAMYDWLGLNELEHKLKQQDGSKTYGALDLGGASTQIAFVPEDTSDIIDEVTIVKPLRVEFRLYAVSHLGYGADQIEERIAAKVYQKTNGKNGAKNPCLFKTFKKTYKKIKRYISPEPENPIQHKQIGSGDAALCEEYLKEVLDLKSAQCDVYSPGECSINGVYIPPIPETMQWVAFSKFFFAVDALLSKRKGDHGLVPKETGKSLSIAEIYEFTQNNLCHKHWDVIESYTKASNKIPYSKEDGEWKQKRKVDNVGYAETLCLINMYIVVLLRDGYHFDKDARNIEWTGKINGKDVGWDSGSILYDANVLDYKSSPATGSRSAPFHYKEIKKAVVKGIPEAVRKQHLRARYKEIKKAEVTDRALNDKKANLNHHLAKSDYMDYMDDMNEMDDENGYYHQMNPLLLTMSVIFMMVIICIYCICGLGVIGFYSFCCYHQYNKATSDQQHIDIESL